MHDPLSARSGSDEGALGPYRRAIAARRVVVVLVTLAAVVGSIAWLALRTPRYEAVARMLVTPLPQDDTSFLGIQLLRDSGDPTRTVQTAANVVDSPQAAALAARRLGKGWDPGRVAAAVDVQPQGQSNVLAIQGAAGSARAAARVTNEFARSALDTRRREIQTQIERTVSQLETRQQGLQGASNEAKSALADRLDSLQSVRGGGDPTLTLSQRATLPPRPVGASPPLVIAFALVAGLALGIGAAMVLELIDQRIRDEDEATELFPLPILARVPALSQREQSAGAAQWSMLPAVLEAFRTVLVQLDNRRSDQRSPAIMVTSASTGDGKTTAAINLAISVAAAGHEAILIDLDIGKLDVHSQLGLREPEPLDRLLFSNKTGSELLSGALVRSEKLPALSVFAPGPSMAPPAVLVDLATRKLPDLLAAARGRAEYVIVDSPPLGEFSDALRLANDIDEILIAVRPGHTERTSFQLMRDLFLSSDNLPTGFVMIGVAGAHRGYGTANINVVLPRHETAFSPH